MTALFPAELPLRIAIERLQSDELIGRRLQNLPIRPATPIYDAFKPYYKEALKRLTDRVETMVQDWEAWGWPAGVGHFASNVIENISFWETSLVILRGVSPTTPFSHYPKPESINPATFPQFPILYQNLFNIASQFGDPMSATAAQIIPMVEQQIEAMIATTAYFNSILKAPKEKYLISAKPLQPKGFWRKWFGSWPWRDRT